MQPYQPFQAQWLMAIAAAFGLAFLLAIGSSGCAPLEPAPVETSAAPHAPAR